MSILCFQLPDALFQFRVFGLGVGQSNSRSVNHLLPPPVIPRQRDARLAAQFDYRTMPAQSLQHQVDLAIYRPYLCRNRTGLVWRKGDIVHIHLLASNTWPRLLRSLACEGAGGLAAPNVEVVGYMACVMLGNITGGWGKLHTLCVRHAQSR
jgi:hypothetical protein